MDGENDYDGDKGLRRISSGYDRWWLSGIIEFFEVGSLISRVWRVLGNAGFVV
jgi:hypothetical protein